MPDTNLDSNDSPYLGLITMDDALVESVVARFTHDRLNVVVADADTASDVFTSDRFSVRIVDFRAKQMLPSMLCTRCPMLAPGAGDDDVVVLLGRSPGACTMQSSVVRAYSREQIPGMLDDIAAVLPALATPRDAAEVILGHSPAVRLVRDQIRSVARYRDVSVLILGETGTGKELVAEAIHHLSGSAERPFVAVNCAAIPEALFESELFGHEAGAYTGARGARAGLFESASGGTIFLDEVGEMPPSLQPKLLRVLETRRFRRVGGSRDIPFYARVISATNRGIVGRSDSTLRADLHFRLAGFTILLPPLRDRLADVEELATAFLSAFAQRHPKPFQGFEADAMALLRGYSWPGNVRELRAVVEHAAIVARGSTIEAKDVASLLEARPRPRVLASTMPPALVPPTPPQRPRPGVTERKSPAPAPPSPLPPSPVTLRDVERDIVVRLYEANEGNISRTAKQLGIARSTLREKLRRYGVPVG